MTRSLIRTILRPLNQLKLGFLLSILILSNTTGSVYAALDIDRQADYLVWHDNVCNANSGGSALPGNNNAEKAYNFLIAHGYSPEQAAGMVGNMILESGVGPERLQGTPLNTRTSADQARGSSQGWGIVQWTPAGKFINNAPGDPNSLDTQLNYLVANDGLNGGAGDPKTVADKMKSATTVEEATQYFGQYYEAPLDLSASIAERQMYAKAIYEQATKGTPLPPEVAAAIVNYSDNSPANTQAVSNNSKSQPNCQKTSNSDCQNPFRDLQNASVNRFDGGLDYGGSGGTGPVYAACSGKVVFSQTAAEGSGWPGNPGLYLVYKIEGGKADGLNIYITEDCFPKVKVGDSVTPTTEVCTYQDSGTMLEIGWSTGGNSYVEWSDYPGKPNNYASNSGLDIGAFLESLGVAPGLVQGEKSTTPPPPDWPKWTSSNVSV